MTPIEKKKLTVELLKVSAAKADLELKIDLCLEEVERLKGHIKVQEDKEEEIKNKLQ